jgi:MoaA/NifB/PqqE/SkfB family radical SAM enzyme
MATVYNTYKALAFPDRIDALRENRLAAPVNIRLKPINHCNHDCWYCAYRVDNLKLGEDIDLKDVIPTEKMFEMAHDFIDMGVKAVTLSGGGEPLLYKPLPEIMELLSKGGVRIGALTNGSNLKKKVADAFADFGTWVRISLEGWDGRSYAKARGVSENAFDELMSNITAFAKRGSSCTIGASFIMGADNYKHIHEAISRLRDTGIHHVKLSGVVVSNDGAENNAYHRKLQPEISEQVERAKELSTDGFAVLDHYHLLDERFSREYETCPTIQFVPVIGADCKVYSCHDKAYTADGELGSIKDRSFKDFWFSEENRQKAFAINPKKDCPHHCADHLKNIALHEFLATDPEHVFFA